MAKKKKVALERVLQPDENIYWQGKPEKMAYILCEFKDELPEVILRSIFDLILLPNLFFNSTIQFQPTLQFLLILLWVWHLKPLAEKCLIPWQKSLEWKNTYYIITDKNIYIQFGTNQIYYRAYPSDRVGTKVFYRKNKIDSTLFVGTIGFSVDDYYEERIMSIKDYEDVFKILKGFAAQKKEILQAQMDAEQERQLELLRQQEILNQSEELQKQKEELSEKAGDEYEFESYDAYKKRMQEKEMQEKESQEEREEQERLEREREHEELINKYNEYRKRHDMQKENKASIVKDSANVETFTYNTADDSRIEDGVEIEFPVTTPQQPKQNPNKKNNKRGKAPKKSYKYDPTKKRPPVDDYQPERKPSKPQDDDVELDMSSLWENINSLNDDDDNE